MSTPFSTTTSGQMLGEVISLAVSGVQPLTCRACFFTPTAEGGGVDMQTAQLPWQANLPFSLKQPASSNAA